MTLRVSGKNLDIGEALRRHVLEKVEATVARYFSGSVGRTCRDHARRLRLPFRLHVAPQLGGQPARRGPSARTLPLLRSGGRQDRNAGCAATRPVSRAIPAPPRRMRGARSPTIWSSSRARKRKNQPRGFNPVVVAEGTDDLKSLSVASAVAELDLTGAPVVVFQHAGSGRVNVVYRRPDGAIGWLDPQAPREPSRAA